MPEDRINQFEDTRTEMSVPPAVTAAAQAGKEAEGAGASAAGTAVINAPAGGKQQRQKGGGAAQQQPGNDAAEGPAGSSSRAPPKKPAKELTKGEKGALAAIWDPCLGV